MHSTLSTALCCKTAAFIGAGVYQVFYIAGVGVGVGVRDGIWDGNVSRNRRRRYTTEFLGDRVEELWGLVGRGKDGVCELSCPPSLLYFSPASRILVLCDENRDCDSGYKKRVI